MPGLPKRQLFVLSCCRLAEPIAFTSVFPYLYNLIRDLHITDDEKKIGKYGGLVSSVFSLGSFLTGLAWGRASDTYGRKPIILLGLIGTIISTLIFGFSTSIYQLVGARLAAGLLNGNVGVIRTVVAEMVTDRRYQATAFSIMPIVWSIGSIFGPALGGALADPVRAYPWLFKDNKFFTKFRYALPNLVTAALLLVGVSIGWLFLDETLAIKKGEEDTGLRVKNWIAQSCCCCGGRQHKKGHYRLASANSVSDDVEQALMSGVRPSTAGSEAIEALNRTASKDEPEASKASPAPPLKELFTPQVTLNIIAYSTLSAHTTSFDQIFPMYLATSLKDGGLSLEPQTIGVLLSVIGLVAMILQITVFPPLQRRLGSAWCLRLASAFYTITYACIPVLHRVAGESQNVVFAGVLVVLFFKVLAGVVAFPSSAILVTNAVPTARLLGSVNGLNQAIGSFARMVGPAIFGFLLSYSLESGLRALVWFGLAIVAAVGGIVSCMLLEDVRRPDLDEIDQGMTLGADTNRKSHELPTNDSFDNDDENDDVVDHLLEYERHERRRSLTLRRESTEQ
ncbi:protein of unknown function [Taphrina deformans PYCC 5710]|uniref:Major facilitator superfamily (MFS) profile domain-containing protein n=1 Tax=Taphrina deformans (strain PYCC 5710 / ATCC 11124 / CBS 356.35 / IMI 108563 / JCM 9778 / NBRC 8474) TaxID=1097556 RepID=R4XDK9_TAPDE|nr:protein of unknown function [Taphrina deformans PYCC 5710]|eukprot:CCG83686.1 protein of unknown function [Taphrina deformans PYCC 5710]